MKARRLDLSECTVDTPDGPKPYALRKSLTNLLCSPHRELNGAALLKAHRLATLIEDEESDSLLLSDEQYKELESAFETFRGFVATDAEMVKRVLEAPEVDVEEKQ